MKVQLNQSQSKENTFETVKKTHIPSKDLTFKRKRDIFEDIKQEVFQKAGLPEEEDNFEEDVKDSQVQEISSTKEVQTSAQKIPKESWNYILLVYNLYLNSNKKNCE